MKPSAQLEKLVAQMPDPDSRGMYTTDIDKEKIDRAIAEIQGGGRDSILGLIDMLVVPGEGDDTKAHYALHCLANRALIDGNESARRTFSETVASDLGENRPRRRGDEGSGVDSAAAMQLPKAVKAFLCQELQWAGRKEATPALGGLLLDEELVEPAAMALVAIRDGAAEQFRKALPTAKGKCRLNIVQGLGAIEDTQSAGALREAITDADREVRLAAGWGLSRMGDIGSVDLLIKAADVPHGWERVKATKHCLVLAEKLAAAGSQSLAAKIAIYLRRTRTGDDEAYVREAADQALAAQ